MRYFPKKHSKRQGGPPSYCLIKPSWYFNIKARMAEKWVSISLKPLLNSTFRPHQSIKGNSTLFFIYKLSDILLQSSLIYSESLQVFSVQLYQICIHSLHLYMHTFKYVSKYMNYCCNFVLQKLNSIMMQVWVGFF